MDPSDDSNIDPCSELEDTESSVDSSFIMNGNDHALEPVMPDHEILKSDVDGQKSPSHK